MLGGLTARQGEGSDVKILKAVIRLRKQEPAEQGERDKLRDTYLHANEIAGPLLSRP